MTIAHLSLLLAYSIGMAGGQLLFKLAAMSNDRPEKASLPERLLALALDKYFIAALVLYLALSVVWVWILTMIPISRAYPFFALNFILVALAGWLLFSERLSIVNGIGLLMIAAGIVLATHES